MLNATLIKAAATLALFTVLTAGCGNPEEGPSGSKNSAAAAADAFTIGVVSPQTGPLSGFGEADQFVVDQMREHFSRNPVSVGGKKLNVEIVVRDAQSDSKRAGEVAAELINSQGADLILAQGTPDIVNPVADQCEANATPCITTVAPWQPYYLGRGATKEKPFTWTYHFFWGLEDVAATYEDMWSQVSTNKTVSGLFPNDPDGRAWSGAFPSLVKDASYTIDNPGLYFNGSQDFSAQISAFKSNHGQILTGVPVPPDFTNFWKQAKQQGFNPKVATVGKALLFPSSLEALGDLGNNLGTEVWWTPSYPFTSSLTKQSAAELAAAYEQKTGRQWTQPLGFAEALFEVSSAAVTAAGSADKHAVAGALKTLKVSTVVGDLDWTAGPVPNVAKTPLTGGQWRWTPDGKHPYDLVIVSNKLNPSIPTGGKVEPLQ